MRIDLSPKVLEQVKNLGEMPYEQKVELVELLDQYNEYRKYRKIYYYNCDPVFNDFFRKGKDERIRGLIAANRTGKTYSSTYELACHLTGIYPTEKTHGWDWPGLKYPSHIDAWALGVTSESIHSPGNLRDLLFGPPEAVGTGWIPKDMIDGITYSHESKGIIKEAKIKHVNGGISTVGFRVYSQGSSVLMGASIDLFLVDECPRDDTIFPQLLTRIQKAKGKMGRAIVAATPEYGLDPLVSEFYNDDGQYHEGLCQVTVWDVSHISDDDIEQMKKDYPNYQHDMRLKGIPIMGSGAVYPITKEDIEYDGVKIENHWKQIQGLDFGWATAAAVVSCAYNPDDETIYVFRAKKKSEWDLPNYAAYINSIGSFVPVIWPHDGANGTQAGGGIGLRDQLADLGCSMHWERFHNPVGPDGKKSNSVEDGLAQIRTLLKLGRLKIHSSLSEFWSEYQTYYYDPRTLKPKKTNDHIMDAFRYAVLSVKDYGISKTDEEFEEIDYQQYIDTEAVEIER